MFDFRYYIFHVSIMYTGRSHINASLRFQFALVTRRHANVHSYNLHFYCFVAVVAVVVVFEWVGARVPV